MEGAPARPAGASLATGGRGEQASPARSVGPFLAGAALVSGAVLAGSPGLVVLGIGLTVLGMPLAPDLGRRILVGCLWIAASVGTASLVPGGFPVHSGGLIALVMITTAFVVAMARHSRWPGSIPLIRPEVLVVCAGAGLVLLVLSLPLWGRGAELVLLDTATRYDPLPHYSVMSGLLDGDPWRPGYNYGYHLLGALVFGVRPDHLSGMSALAVTDYVLVGIGVASMCALMLGMLAMEMARSLVASSSRRHTAAGLGASVAFLVVAPLSGLFGSFYLLGHVNFLWAVTAVTAASWLSLQGGIPSHRAAGFVLLGVVAAFTTYRSTQVGMAVPAFLVTKVVLDRQSGLQPPWRWALASVAGVVAFAGWVPFHYYEPTIVSRLSTASVSAGAAVAAPAVTTVVSVTLLLCLAYVVVGRFGSDQEIGRILAPLVGFGAFAGAFAIVVARGGGQLDNYYIWKSASAMYIAGFPGILACAVVIVTLTTRRRAGEAAVVVAAAASVCAVVLLLLPHMDQGLTKVPSGVQMLQSRIDTLDAAPIQGSGVLEAGILVADAPGVALVLPPDAWRWEHRRETATLWLSALIADPQAASDTPAPSACANSAGWSVIEACVARWSRNFPDAPLTIVDLADRIPEASGFAERHPDIRLVRGEGGIPQA